MNANHNMIGHDVMSVGTIFICGRDFNFRE